jgi:hypothetical protein
MGCVPVICACCAMRTVESRTIDDGFGRMEVRFGAVDVRRLGSGRLGAGCADIFEVVLCCRLSCRLTCGG